MSCQIAVSVPLADHLRILGHLGPNGTESSGSVGLWRATESSAWATNRSAWAGITRAAPATCWSPKVCCSSGWAASCSRQSLARALAWSANYTPTAPRRGLGELEVSGVNRDALVGHQPGQHTGANFEFKMARGQPRRTVTESVLN